MPQSEHTADSLENLLGDAAFVDCHLDDVLSARLHDGHEFAVLLASPGIAVRRVRGVFLRFTLRADAMSSLDHLCVQRRAGTRAVSRQLD